MNPTYLNKLNHISNKLYSNDFKDLDLEHQEFIYKLEKRNSLYDDDEEN